MNPTHGVILLFYVHAPTPTDILNLLINIIFRYFFRF